MKKKMLTLGVLLLGGCLAALAQSETHPTRNQSGEAGANLPAAGQGVSGESSAQAATQVDNSQASTLRGCLSQSSDGNFMLADKSGNNFQLQGDASQLDSYIGKEIQVHGSSLNSSGTSADAMASDTGGATGAAKQFTVSDVHKVADTCASSK